jgi:hypothetical protein
MYTKVGIGSLIIHGLLCDMFHVLLHIGHFGIVAPQILVQTQGTIFIEI